VLHLDTESDLWQARSSLVVTDTSGADIAMPDEVRVYTVSGVSHAPFRPLPKPVMQLPGNQLGYGAFMRALLVAIGGSSYIKAIVNRLDIRYRYPCRIMYYNSNYWVGY